MTFTWEQPPFEECNHCGEKLKGILWVSGNELLKRCVQCRQSSVVDLPVLHKKAIYLDQFMFSLIYNVKNGGNLPLGHERFAREVFELIQKCVLLQQVFLPHSDIHHDETTVFHSAIELRGLYQSFGGDVSLLDRREIELRQTLSFAKAYFEGREPELNFDLGEVTEANRNDWIPKMHILAKADYSQFADEIRRVRSEVHEAFKSLAKIWAERKPDFQMVLNEELTSLGSLKREALGRWLKAALSPDTSNPLYSLEIAGQPIYREYRELTKMLMRLGVKQVDCAMEIDKFWSWERLADLPHHRISSYLFAATARRVSGGEKR